MRTPAARAATAEGAYRALREGRALPLNVWRELLEASAYATGGFLIYGLVGSILFAWFLPDFGPVFREIAARILVSAGRR